MWVNLGLMQVVDFQKFKRHKVNKMDANQRKEKSIQKVDALDIYMRLSLWQAYVSSIRRDGKVPKMEWTMTVEDFDRIEDILKRCPRHS